MTQYENYYLTNTTNFREQLCHFIICYHQDMVFPLNKQLRHFKIAYSEFLFIIFLPREELTPYNYIALNLIYPYFFTLLCKG